MGRRNPCRSNQRRCPPPQPPSPSPPPCPVSVPREPVHLRPEEMVFVPLEVPGFPPGASVALIYGNPFAPCEAFAVRIRFPAGYVTPVHTEGITSNIIVIEGSFTRTIIGEAPDTFGPLDFLLERSGEPHFLVFHEDTLVEAHGVGPFASVAHS